MGRRDTMAKESYRVQVERFAPDGRELSRTVTHESIFWSLESARSYFDSLDIPGSYKKVQHRAAGKSRYKTIENAYMVSALMASLPEGIDQ